MTFSCQKQDEQATKEAKPTVDLKADIAAIKGVIKKYEAAANAGDLDSFLSVFADDCVRMPDGAPSRIGIAQIKKEFKPLFDQFAVDLKITSIEEAKAFKDIIVTRCSFNVAVTPKTGGDKIIIWSDEKTLTIWKKQADGNWKMIYDCMNSNLQPKQQ